MLAFKARYWGGKIVLCPFIQEISVASENIIIWEEHTSFFNAAAVRGAGAALVPLDVGDFLIQRRNMVVGC